MEAYRDQYATLFNNGRNVVVLGISVDPDTALASWARDEDFPVLFASDPGSRVGQLYGAYDTKYKAVQGPHAFSVHRARCGRGQSRSSTQAGIDQIVKSRGPVRGSFSCSDALPATAPKLE